MKINDKVIVAFLVSVGIYSSMQARQYVGSLSVSEKKSLYSVANMSKEGALICAEEKQRTELENT